MQMEMESMSTRTVLEGSSKGEREGAVGEGEKIGGGAGTGEENGRENTGAYK